MTKPTKDTWKPIACNDFAIVVAAAIVFVLLVCVDREFATIVVVFICIWLGDFLLDDVRCRLDLCVWWITLILYRTARSVVVVDEGGSPTSAYIYAALLRSAAESSGTVTGGLGLSAFVDYFCSVSWRLIFDDCHSPNIAPKMYAFRGGYDAFSILLWNLLVGMPFADRIDPEWHMALCFVGAFLKAFHTSSLLATLSLWTIPQDLVHEKPYLRILIFDIFSVALPVFVTALLISKFNFGAWVYVVAHFYVVKIVEALGTLLTFCVVVWSKETVPLQTVVNGIRLFCAGPLFLGLITRIICSLVVAFYHFETQLVVVAVSSILELLINSWILYDMLSCGIFSEKSTSVHQPVDILVKEEHFSDVGRLEMSRQRGRLQKEVIGNAMAAGMLGPYSGLSSRRTVGFG